MEAATAVRVVEAVGRVWARPPGEGRAGEVGRERGDAAELRAVDEAKTEGRTGPGAGARTGATELVAMVEAVVEEAAMVAQVAMVVVGVAEVGGTAGRAAEASMGRERVSLEAIVPRVGGCRGGGGREDQRAR